MKAQLCTGFGPVTALEWTDVPDPIPGSGEIVVKNHAIGVNFADALVIEGRYQARPRCPFIPGTEIAGEVVAVGDDCTRYRPGDRVHAYNNAFGAFAEMACVPETIAYPLPQTLSYREGAALLAATGTAHHALRQRGRLRAGETLVVLGAAGGTGSAAVQIGRAIGASVIAVASSEEKLALAREMGATSTINYTTEDLRERVKELTGGRGADVVYDTVGGDAFDACTRAVAWNGRILVVGFASGRIPELAVNLTLVKGFAVLGVFWGSFIEREPDVHAANMQELYEWVERGLVRPAIDRAFPLADCPAALHHLSSRGALGKVVLEP